MSFVWAGDFLSQGKLVWARVSGAGCVWAGLWTACPRNKKGNQSGRECAVYPEATLWAVCGLVC